MAAAPVAAAPRPLVLEDESEAPVGRTDGAFDSLPRSASVSVPPPLPLEPSPEATAEDAPPIEVEVWIETPGAPPQRRDDLVAAYAVTGRVDPRTGEYLYSVALPTTRMITNRRDGPLAALRPGGGAGLPAPLRIYEQPSWDTPRAPAVAGGFRRSSSHSRMHTLRGYSVRVE